MCRIQGRIRLLSVLLMVWLALGTASAAARPAVIGVDAVVTTVSNMDRAVDFYTHVLSFETISDSKGPDGGSSRVARLRLGDEFIELVQFSTAGQAFPHTQSNDHWFQHLAIIVSDMDRAYAKLRANHVEGISPAPQRLPDWNRKAAGIQAYYFKDPDGHPLEILQFPPDKGLAKWHRKDALFLGIDHTAIVVTNTETSIHFYRDLLGFEIAGTSENYGPEQERLNNVPGAHLRITTLRAPAGPGVELLEYLAPRDGRSLPSAPRASDLVHRHTVLLTGNIGALRRIPLGTAAGRTNLQYANGEGETGAFCLRDPDGHELLVHGK